MFSETLTGQRFSVRRLAAAAAVAHEDCRGGRSAIPCEAAHHCPKGIDEEHTRAVIGQLEKTVPDCPDPRALALFYCGVLGMQVNQDLGDWTVIGSSPDRRELAFQRVHDYMPPSWPEAGLPQQMHLDIRVQDPDRAEAALLRLGARRQPTAAETVYGSFRTFLDPAGHPFCIVFGKPPRGPSPEGEAVACAGP